MTSGESPLLIALSGPTSSGKTTVASALTSIFPQARLTLVHADDFYKSDSAIPLHPTGVQDWDCAAAIDLPRFRQTLQHIKNGGALPDDLVQQGGVEDGVHASPKDQNQASVSPECVARLQDGVEAWLPRGAPTIVLVEGFLLFGEAVWEELGRLFDRAILLRATRANAGRRRASRNGYVTLEGFWQDPPGYFEQVVWPNYVKEHGYLFEDGDVEGEAVRSTDGKMKEVKIGPVNDVGLEMVCEWVVGCIQEAVVAEARHGETES